jgi:hypothetical protein
VTKIETERAYQCGGDQDGSGGSPSPNPAGKLYGVINTLPATLIGEWRIGTMLIYVAANGNLPYAFSLP